MIRDLCFNAETDVRPEFLTSIFVDYSRFEIEAAARAFLRVAIFLCDHTSAVSPNRDTARRLGVAIVDATGVRALKVYKGQKKENSIDFNDHIIEKFLFPIREVRTDNVLYAERLADLASDHCRVERSHRSDQQEFYQLLSYKDDVDLDAKLDEWERFYSFARPHSAHNGDPLRSSQCQATVSPQASRRFAQATTQPGNLWYAPRNETENGREKSTAEPH